MLKSPLAVITVKQASIDHTATDRNGSNGDSRNRPEADSPQASEGHPLRAHHGDGNGQWGQGTAESEVHPGRRTGFSRG